ncbi:MAG: universal stress protein [Pararhodobacter sp.]|nr:universal stress protein [Pararhodobacter sp.]
MLKSILAAFDFSSRSEPAVQRAVQLAAATEARLTLLHVVEDDLPGDSMHAPTCMAEDLLKRQLQDLRAPDNCEKARAREADHIVIGTRGFSGVKRFFLSSGVADILAVPPGA